MRPRRRVDVTSRWLADEEVALLTPDGTQLLLLNTLGGVIWELCDGQRSVEDIAVFVSENFAEVSVQRIGTDVTHLVEELEAAGCLDAG